MLIIFGVLMLIIPSPGRTNFGVECDIQLLLQNLEHILGRRYHIAGQVIDLSAVISQVTEALSNLMTPVFSQTLALVGDVITSVVWVIFIAVVSFYLIRDDLVLRDYFEKLIPPAYRQDFVTLRSEINHIWSGFFRGQLILALVVALFLASSG
jgi:predicted PurR-regulated permease PerM